MTLKKKVSEVELVGKMPKTHLKRYKNSNRRFVSSAFQSLNGHCCSIGCFVVWNKSSFATLIREYKTSNSCFADSSKEKIHSWALLVICNVVKPVACTETSRN